MQPKIEPIEDVCTLATGAAATTRPAFLVASAVDTRAPTRRTTRMATVPAEFAAWAIDVSDATTRSLQSLWLVAGLWGRWLMVRGGLIGVSLYSPAGDVESGANRAAEQTNEISGKPARYGMG
jgi:hypothetical protein